MGKEILTSKEVMEYFQISKTTLLKMIHEGKLRFFKVGKNYRFKKSELEEDLRGNK